MNDLQNEIWKEACEEEEKLKGYVSAELLWIPMLVKMAEEGKIEVDWEDDFMVIGSKGILDKFKGDKNGN